MKTCFSIVLLFLSISSATCAMEEKETPLNGSATKYIIFEIDDILTQANEGLAVKDHLSYLNVNDYMRFGDLAAWFVNTLASGYVKTEAHKISTGLMQTLCENHEFDNLKNDTQVLYRARPLPSLWCAYYLNKITGKEAVERAKETIAQYTEAGSDNRKYFNLAVELGFNPTTEVNYLQPIEKGFDLAKDCAANPNNRVFICSNKNINTMQELVARYPDFFALFKDSIITSGEAGMLKPNLEFYKKIIRDYAIDLDNCYFVDSQGEYLEPIAQLGARVIEINPNLESDFDEARQYFIEEGIILPENQ